MKAIYTKIPDELYKKFKIKLIKQNKLARDVIANLIEKWINENEK